MPKISRQNVRNEFVRVPYRKGVAFWQPRNDWRILFSKHLHELAREWIRVSCWIGSRWWCCWQCWRPAESWWRITRESGIARTENWKIHHNDDWPKPWWKSPHQQSGKTYRWSAFQARNRTGKVPGGMPNPPAAKTCWHRCNHPLQFVHDRWPVSEIPCLRVLNRRAMERDAKCLVLQMAIWSRTSDLD